MPRIAIQSVVKLAQARQHPAVFQRFTGRRLVQSLQAQVIRSGVGVGCLAVICQS